jgi:hypothetical protein
MSAARNLPEPGSTDSTAANLSLTVPRARRVLILAIILHLCALTFYWFAVLRIDYEKTALLDLNPYPDAAEYFGQAQAMAAEGKPSIQIGYDKLPSRYPPGYPVLMLPWFKLLPKGAAILAPFRANQTIGLLLLIAIFVLYLWRKKPLSGAFATLLLATLPAFVSFSRSSLSEISGGAVAVMAFVLVYLGLADKSRWQIYVAAVVLGLAISIRVQLIFFTPLLLAMALFPSSDSRAKRLLHSAAVLVVFASAATPLLLVNALELGHPLKTGYTFWLSNLAERRLPFSMHNIVRHAGIFWSEFTFQWKEFRVANLFGTGTYFVPSFFILTLIGLAFIRRDRFAICVFLGGFSFLAATATYDFVDGRFYLPLLVLCVAVAVLPLEWMVTGVVERKRGIVAFVILALFLLSVLGYPSQSGYKPQRNRFQAWDALQFAKTHRESPRFEAEKSLLEKCAGQPGIVFSNIDPVYLNALLPRPFAAAPLDAKHHYANSHFWHYGEPEAIALLKRGLAESVPVYSLFTSIQDLKQNSHRLPTLDGYQWVTMENSQTKAVIMKFVPLPSD